MAVNKVIVSMIMAGALLGGAGLTATTSSASSAGVVTTSLPDTCLPTASDPFGLHLGLPRSPFRSPTVGRLGVAVIYADFDDAPAQVDVATMHARTIPDGIEHLEALAHGLLDVTTSRSPRWVRMPKPMSYYLDAPSISTDGGKHRQFIADAIASADSIMDFTGIDIVGVVLDQAPRRFPLGIAFIGDDYSSFEADGHKMTDGFTLMHPIFNIDTVVAHEILHNLGLVDLYDGSVDGLASPDPRDRFVGEFGTMGNSRGHSPELFGWEQWILGWIPDDDIACVTTGSQEITLSAVSTTSGTRLAIVPLGANRFAAFEVRAQHGLDNPPQSGVLPYVVSPDTPTAQGPIRIPPTRDPLVMDPLQVGSQWVMEGVAVEVLSGSGTSYHVRVHTEVPKAIAPGPVQGLRSSPSARGIAVTWSAPLARGWAEISGYEYRVGTGRWTPTSKTAVIVKAIKRGSTARVQVRAINEVGSGAVASISLARK